MESLLCSRSGQRLSHGREGTTRGSYAGCLAYFSFNGNLDTCITIRTALLKDGKAYVQAGGGWVNDSEPEAEFRETVNQSKAMLKAAALAETFGSVESGRKVWRPRFICSNGKPPGRLNKQSRANGYSVR